MFDSIHLSLATGECYDCIIVDDIHLYFTPSSLQVRTVTKCAFQWGLWMITPLDYFLILKHYCNQGEQKDLCASLYSALVYTGPFVLSVYFLEVAASWVYLSPSDCTIFFLILYTSVNFDLSQWGKPIDSCTYNHVLWYTQTKTRDQVSAELARTCGHIIDAVKYISEHRRLGVHIMIVVRTVRVTPFI